ncbi:IcmT/TraK family protein [Ochrobactrum sp. BTU1]|uniref:IcmT/TraK family protein n=1 Tax=Ochrobactrum sp. BTU1 TaxID=2840456 RepID=UPI001C05EBF7|nr:IcmT/TraK family protein [Ochrobactrum sp. BTU1]
MSHQSDIFGRTVEWRETMRNPSFFMLDGYFVLFLPLFFFHIRWWTFTALIIAAFAFGAMRFFKYRPSSAFRAVRSALAGSLRPCRPRYKARSSIDYGFEY